MKKRERKMTEEKGKRMKYLYVVYVPLPIRKLLCFRRAITRRRNCMTYRGVA